MNTQKLMNVPSVMVAYMIDSNFRYLLPQLFLPISILCIVAVIPISSLFCPDCIHVIAHVKYIDLYIILLLNWDLNILDIYDLYIHIILVKSEYFYMEIKLFSN